MIFIIWVFYKFSLYCRGGAEHILCGCVTVRVSRFEISAAQVAVTAQVVCMNAFDG